MNNKLYQKIQASKVTPYKAGIAHQYYFSYFFEVSRLISKIERINLLQVGNSAKSKHELYQILTVEGGMYLRPEKECSITFISEI